MTTQRALITGIFGQDAAYLARHLIDQGYEIIGTHRRTSTNNSWRLRELDVERHIRFEELELLEQSNIIHTLKETRPTEIYNLAAQSFVGSSFNQPIFTGEANALGVTRILEAIRVVDPEIRFYQASTSEMFGLVQETPQKETTAFYPRSPYGISKLYAHWMTKNYREAYGLHATSGILFNHESPLRGTEFVTRKITTHFAAIKFGLIDHVELGNLNACRDWGHARDYVEGMHAMVRHDEADDFVLASGQTHTIEDFANLAASVAGFKIEWEGEAEDRKAYNRETGKCIIKVNPRFYRPTEVDLLMGDAGKAKDVLGWAPRTNFENLVEEMMAADLDRQSRTDRFVSN
ncbi:MAG: GDP-mannose 4,6-dehydratase [Alphaproteobacteria bacterium]|nr:MAG: GDP-mannose 4,6-dehydratase [Alphaproteobacteria bacterium]